MDAELHPLVNLSAVLIGVPFGALAGWLGGLNEYLPSIRTKRRLSAFPALMIALTMDASTLMGDGLHDARDPPAGHRG